MPRCHVLLAVLLHHIFASDLSCAAFDGSVHVWDAEAPFPFPGGEPPSDLGRAGSFHQLLASLADANATAAAIVQPSNYKFDHRYVEQALFAHPNVFVGVGLLDPSLGQDGVKAQMVELVGKGFVSFRLNAALVEAAGEFMDGPIATAIAAEASRLQVSLSLFSFTGIGAEAEAIDRLVSTNPNTIFAVDHMGLFLQPATGEGPNRIVDVASLEGIMILSKYSNVFLKVSALFRLVVEDVMELVPHLSSALQHFGSGRMLWGSDFPFVVQHGGIDASRKSLSVALRASGASMADEEAIFCSTARRLFSATRISA